VSKKKRKKKPLHEAYSEKHSFHDSVSSYDGGACLCKHVIDFKDNDSCSYRWQGVNKASEQPGRAAYDAHSKLNCRFAGRGQGAFQRDEIGSVTASAGRRGVVVNPRKHTKYGLRAIITVNNFTTGRVPYGNQVHHVLNQSSLHKGIDELATIWEPIRWAVVDGLLEEKYNLNHRDNNLILPTSEKDCRQTGLPKHCGAHPKYNTQILDAVKQALSPYQTIANQMKKKRNHDPMDPEQLKDDLVVISNTMYSNIILLAAANRAKGSFVSINDLPSNAYRGL
jgi:hypothetical protein